MRVQAARPRGSRCLAASWKAMRRAPPARSRTAATLSGDRPDAVASSEPRRPPGSGARRGRNREEPVHAGHASRRPYGAAKVAAAGPGLQQPWRAWRELAWPLSAGRSRVSGCGGDAGSGDVAGGELVEGIQRGCEFWWGAGPAGCHEGAQDVVVDPGAEAGVLLKAGVLAEHVHGDQVAVPVDPGLEPAAWWRAAVRPGPLAAAEQQPGVLRAAPVHVLA